MGRFLIRLIIFLFVGIFSIVIYLSYFGLETDKFNKVIKSRANEISSFIKLDFKKTKIHLNLKELNLVVKLQEPKVLVANNEIFLTKLDLFIGLKSFIDSDFLLKRTEVAFAENDIKDLTKVTDIFLPRIINKKLNKVFAKGNLEGEFIIPFNPDGSVGKKYRFSGKVIEASINLTEKLVIKNLTTEINYGVDGKENILTAELKKGTLFDLNLSGSKINFKNKKNIKNFETSLQTKGKINFEQIKILSSLFSFKANEFEEINAIANLETKINFDLDNNFRIKNLFYSTEGILDNFEIHTKNRRIIKKYLPEYNPKIIIKDTKVEFNNSKDEQNIELNGLIKTKDNYNTFEIKQNFVKNNKNFNIIGTLDLTDSKVKISRLNYIKDEGKKSEIFFEINFILNKFYNIKNLTFSENKTKIYLSDIKLNKNFELNDLKKINIKTFLNNIKNNDFIINKSDKIIISGEIFDAQPLLKTIYKKSEKKIFSKKFNAGIKVNFNKTLTGTKDDVFNMGIIANINKGSYDKLSLKGNFSENEIIEMSIYQVDANKKTLQIISDRAKPFIKNFKFIKGFEGGKLEYESIIFKKVSKSNLIINDFKVSKVPALAKLLTLASLQGIADTLSGEGIRFDTFEMKSNSEGNILNIEDALAIGPAVSILLEGYVDKGKTVSLRGTLVPATKLNSIIASIPIVGDILVGKKTGEGVVGVSFKMKGPPKDIKTTVNPIKTLTPRFIVRAIEKMKKKNLEEVK